MCINVSIKCAKHGWTMNCRKYIHTLQCATGAQCVTPFSVMIIKHAVLIFSHTLGTILLEMPQVPELPENVAFVMRCMVSSSMRLYFLNCFLPRISRDSVKIHVLQDHNISLSPVGFVCFCYFCHTWYILHLNFIFSSLICLYWVHRWRQLGQTHPWPLLCIVWTICTTFSQGSHHGVRNLYRL